MDKLTLEKLSIPGKKILTRVDFNVPISTSGAIEDDTRIRAAVPTILYILKHGGSIILMSHLGRPDGKKNHSLSLEPCAKALSQILHKDVKFVHDCIGKDVDDVCSHVSPGDIILLENLRFHPEEESGDEAFASKLASLGDLYVNDAFGCAHRDHASVVGITKFFPGKAVAGLLMRKEIDFLGRLLQNPKRPFCAVIGGAKISTKIGTLKALLKKVDILLIGGAMAYTFSKSQGMGIGSSLHEDKFLKEASDIIAEGVKNGVELLLPIDSIVASEISDTAKAEVYAGSVPEGYFGADIGPETIKLFTHAIEKSQTILWNGPMGVFEKKPFAQGTEAIAKCIASSKGVTIVGGGDTLSAIAAAGIADQFTHVSTGGGASLEFLEFGTLPGVEALS